MRDEVMDILRVMARRLALMRAAEAGAVAAIAGGLAAAALQVAWTIAPRYPLAAAGICLLPLLAGAGVVALPARSRIMGVAGRVALVIGGTCIVIGAGGIWGVQAGWYEHVSKALLAVALMPAAAVAGAAAQAVGAVRPTDAAILLDLRYNLRERLSTAAELVAGRTRDNGVTEYVCGQAAAALRRQSGAIRPPWRRTGTTAAMVALVAVLCGVLSVTGGLSSPAQEVQVTAVAAEMRKMSPVEQDDLLARLRKARARQGAGPLRRELTQAEQALQDGDAARLTRLIRALIEAGVDVRSLFGNEMLAAATGAGTKGGAAPETQAAAVAPRPIAAAPAPAYVYVYHPAYAELLAAGAKGGTDSQPATSPGSVLVPFEAAWDAARIRAENNLARSRSKIPPQYHQLIRDFFAEGDQAGG